MAKHTHNSQLFGYLNLDELDGVQSALTKLGYAPGKIDGVDGPNTMAAVKVFQAAASLPVDGIVGPQTKNALVAMLDKNATAGDARA